MDYVRIILAIALSFAVFLVWDLFFAPEPPVRPPATSSDTETVAEPATPEPEPFESEPMTAAPDVSPPGPETTAGGTSVRDITVTTPLYRATISENGAAFKSMVLQEYRESATEESSLKELMPETGQPLVGRIGFDKRSLPGLEDARFSAEVAGNDITVGDRPEDVVFSWTSDQGVVIEKTYRFVQDSYLIGCDVSIKNGSGQLFSDRMYLSLFNRVSSDRMVYGFVGPSALIDGDVKQIKPKNIEDQSIYQGKIDWIANQDRYFMTAALATPPVDASMRLYEKGNDLIENQYLAPEIQVAPGTLTSMSFQLYFGPKSMRVLNKYDNSLVAVVDFGWFDILAKPCLWLMNFIYENLVPNYGIAIIILTLITKIILWPLGTKSYKSMSDMKKLQPLIQEIREKHKEDKKKINEETMALYRTYKINPLGGCLPILVQIPVFIALYRMLYQAIELRHAPFFLWINDLSAPDRLFRFDFAIPMMHEPYGIPVLTLIMGATMLLQQKMSPPMGDPTQRKMMLLMPVVLTVVFINFPAGLVTYWLVNNVVSIAQQYYIQKKSA